MQNYISVLNSDSINLYGDRFTTGALVQGTYDACLLGIPTLYGHDFSKPIGWSFPIGIYFEPGLTRSVAITKIFETKNDRDHVLHWFNRYYDQKLIVPNKSNIEKLKSLLSDCLKGNEEIVIGEAVSIFEKGLVDRKFPEILSLLDKDGLIPIKYLEPLGAGIFRKGDFLLFADGYFRRSFFIRNTLNQTFLKRLLDLDQNNVEVKIAIDHNLIGLADAYFGEKMELEYWWGPKFDDDLLRIPNGITHHEADEEQRSYSGVSRTEFRWGDQSGKKIFEVEELQDVPSNPLRPDNFSCRYAHSMVDVESGIVEHLDGAIRSYTIEEMIERLDLNLGKASRNKDYKKLWRIDGEIDISTWKTLISDYFKNNPLIGEYLGAEDEIIKNRKIIESSREKSIKESYVPYSMPKDSGLRIALSFIQRKEILDKENPAVIPLDHFTLNENEYTCIEALTLEIKKILALMGVELEIPQDISFVKFNDEYVNLPLIYICEKNETNIRQINIALKKIIGFLLDKYDDAVLAFKYGIPIDPDRIALISILGPINCIATWLDNELSIIPDDYIELKRWAESVGKYLQSYSVNFDKPLLTKIFMTTGVLSITRRLIKTREFHIEYSKEMNSYKYEIEFNDEDSSNLDRLHIEGIKPTLVPYQLNACTKNKKIR